METVLEIDGLSKHYGRIKAVDGLSLKINRGTVFGLLGPNGSGKTTTLGMLMQVIAPTSGSFQWFGQEPTPATRRRVGTILETPIFYPYMSGEKNLNIVAKIKGKGHDRIDTVLAQVGLLERKTSPFKTYSLGMKQRLAIAAALLGDPEVMILDEPTNGLDPKGIAEIRELIVEIAHSGKTIILASHLLDEVQKVCTDFAVLSKGRCLYQGGVRETLADKLVVEVGAPDLQGLEAAAQSMPAVQRIDKELDRLMITLGDGQSAFDFNKHLVNQGIVVTHLVTKTKSLEKQFLEILENE